MVHVRHDRACLSYRPGATIRWARHALGGAAAIALLAACAFVAPAGPPRLTHGVAVGDVTPTGAVVWGRCDRATTLHVAIDGVDEGLGTAVSAARDYTGRIALAPLRPDTTYTYRAWCGADPAGAATGGFRTPPDASAARAVRFAWGGDLGGQNVCRDRRHGYPIFADIARRRPDFFVGVGDMIYADDVCFPLGRYGNRQLAGPLPAKTVQGYWAHWRYNRADPSFQRLLAAVPYFPVWDDHEIRDDAGPHNDASWLAPGGHLLPVALQAFLDYQPLLPAAPAQLHRSVRWGRHLELFLLDTRQHRDSRTAPDTAAAGKSMLGHEQIAWLEAAIAASDATWKVLVAGVPLSIPTGAPAARDGFADGGDGTGYEREALRIFRALHAAGGRTLWLATDVHFATGFAYRPFPDDPSWTSHEVISGPLNAGIFPKVAVDETFRPERLFFYGPPSAGTVGSFTDALEWFTYSLIEISADGALSASIINANGDVVFRAIL